MVAELGCDALRSSLRPAPRPIGNVSDPLDAHPSSRPATPPRRVEACSTLPVPAHTASSSAPFVSRRCPHHWHEHLLHLLDDAHIGAGTRLIPGLLCFLIHQQPYCAGHAAIVATNRSVARRSTLLTAHREAQGRKRYGASCPFISKVWEACDNISGGVVRAATPFRRLP